MAAFNRLVRFAQGEAKYFGELLEHDGCVYTVKKLLGSPFDKFEATREVIKTEEVGKSSPSLTQLY
jgi:hypothetical protein